MILMPMLNPGENVIGQRAEEKAKARDAEKAAANPNPIPRTEGGQAAAVVDAT
jgi:hypothetical protein